MSSFREFLAAREIWEVPLAASVVAGALLGFLGVYVVLRRTVFVSAALTQLSTLGLVATLLVEERVHIEAEHAGEQLAVAMAFSVVGALVLGAFRARRLPAEASVGAAWVAASALVVLGTSRLVHAAHDLGGMVFGNAVAVSAAELAMVAVVAALCTAVHAAVAKEIAFTSFDPETARALGMPVQLAQEIHRPELGGRVHPVRRLVEREQLRVRSEGAGDERP
ncbi:MAG TPA: metal ABC transporter permease, partial [Anaeromyxobacter sp.]